MDTNIIILIILAILYVPLFLYVKFGKKLAEKGIVPYGPCVMIKTQLGIKLIKRLGKYKRFWRACGVMSWVVTFVLMVSMVAIIVMDLIMLPSAIGQPGLGITYALAIPGINPMMPLVYGWIALIVAMVVHELAHGFQTNANDMDVKSTGLLWCVVPIGAFVEPDEEQVQKCSRRARMDLYAAGITTNFIVAMITFSIMFFAMTGGMTSDYGDNPAINGITSSSPGYDSGIPVTSIILEVTEEDGSGHYIGPTYTIKTMEDLDNSISHYGYYSLKYVYKDTTETKTVKMGTQVNSVVSGSPADSAGLKSGYFIQSITINGTQTYIGTAQAFSNFMKSTSPNSAATITYIDTNDKIYSKDITLGSNNGVGYLGITTTTSGFSFTTPNTTLQLGINPYYGATTVSDYAMKSLTYLSHPFSGYAPIPEATQWWYHSTFMSDDAFWILISTVYWIFWLNLLLGVTNALPAVPFDGGFLFMGGLDFVLERFIKDEKKREPIVNKISSLVTYAMLFALVLVLIVIIF